MPRKRPLDVRMAEAEDKLDKMRLEKAIQDLRVKMRRTAPRRRRAR